MTDFVVPIHDSKSQEMKTQLENLERLNALLGDIKKLSDNYSKYFSSKRSFEIKEDGDPTKETIEIFPNISISKSDYEKSKAKMLYTKLRRSDILSLLPLRINIINLTDFKRLRSLQSYHIIIKIDDNQQHAIYDDACIIIFYEDWFSLVSSLKKPHIFETDPDYIKIIEEKADILREKERILRAKKEEIIESLIRTPHMTKISPFNSIFQFNFIRDYINKFYTYSEIKTITETIIPKENLIATNIEWLDRQIGSDAQFTIIKIIEECEYYEKYVVIFVKNDIITLIKPLRKAILE